MTYFFSIAFLLIFNLFNIVNVENEFAIKGPAIQKKYGFSEKTPIRVGGGPDQGNHFKFLEHLRGPEGEKLEIGRLGNCGEYENPDPSYTVFGKGVLTCFSITSPALGKSRTLYFYIYRSGELYIPSGLTWKD
jgi:hypothetical protein